MALQAEHSVYKRVVTLFLQNGNRQDIALRLAHFALTVIQVLNMEPVAAPRMPDGRFTLRNFVCVMRENIVHTAAMQVEILAEMLHADCRALDMPAGIADAPRAVPFQFLRIEFGFCEPKHKV